MTVSDIVPVQLNSAVPFLATFNSHDQHVVATQSHGVFMIATTHEAPDAYSPQYENATNYTIYRTTDFQTYTAIYTSGGRHGKPPSIEVNDRDDVFIFDFDFGPYGAYPYSDGLTVISLLASENYATPHFVCTIIGAGASKHTAIFDRARGRFYTWGMQDNPLCIFDRDGNHLSNVNVAQGSGAVSTLEYPHLWMDGARCYLAWTTTPNSFPNSPNPYDGNHYVYSDDGFASFKTKGGAVSVPLVPDDTGPAFSMVPPQYRGCNPWMSGFCAMNGLVHVTYRVSTPANPWRNVYHRFDDLSTVTIDADFPTRSEQISGTAHFTCARDGSALYLVGVDEGQSEPDGRVPILVFKSADNGQHWDLIAKSSQKFNVAGLVGTRYEDGQGLNCLFTHAPNPATQLNAQQLYAFHIPT